MTKDLLGVWVLLITIPFMQACEDKQAIAQKYFNEIEVPIERQCYIAIATYMGREKLHLIPFMDSYMKDGFIHVTYRRVTDSEVFTNRCAVTFVEKNKVTYLIQWLDEENSNYSSGGAVILNYKENGEVSGEAEHYSHTYSYSQVWGKEKPHPLFYEDAT